MVAFSSKKSRIFTQKDNVEKVKSFDEIVKKMDMRAVAIVLKSKGIKFTQIQGQTVFIMNIEDLNNFFLKTLEGNFSVKESDLKNESQTSS